MKITNEVDLTEPVDLIEKILASVSHYLPSQGPISTFVHHNTLHQFEDYEFFDGIEEAARLYSANAYFSEQKYQHEYQKGRITKTDLNKVLGDEGFEASPWIYGHSKRRFYRCLLLSSPPILTAETLRWRMIEKNQINKWLPTITNVKKEKIVKEDKANIGRKLFECLDCYIVPPDQSWKNLWPDNLDEFLNNVARDESNFEWKDSYSITLLWLLSVRFASELSSDSVKSLVYESYKIPRTLVENSARENGIAELVNPYLIKFTSCFLDNGLAHLSVSDRDKGLLRSFISHSKHASFLKPNWLKYDFHNFEKMSGVEAISYLLEQKKIPKGQWDKYLLSKALILKGWAGLIHQSEIFRTMYNHG